MTLITWIYAIVAVWIAVYGANAFVLTMLYWYRRRAHTDETPPAPSEWPHVTVQLPIYNERNVAGRLINAVGQLDYPRDRLEIQVLDDSTDDTKALVDRFAERWRERGTTISVIRRPDRSEYKAGALKYGLEQATGKYVAVFDADFVPPRDWLKHTVSILHADEELGLVQTRWSHLNTDYSPLTHAQALALDGHFGVEQAARADNNLFLNFNGTAGLWRRACIDDAGGWRGETLSEDLDLSYRAQLRGWRLCYRPEIEAPAEIPVQMAAFKRQQFRWAKGSVQCARLLWKPLLRSDASWWVKLQSMIHLTGYFVHFGMVVLLLATLPLMLMDSLGSAGTPPAWLGLASLGAPLLYIAAQHALHTDWQRRIRWLPALMLLGVGVAVNNTRAVIEGLFRRGGTFRRTPKFGVERPGDDWKARAYRLYADWATWGELFMALYAGATMLVAIVQHRWLTVPFVALYAFGFLWVGGLTLWQALQPRSQKHRRRSAQQQRTVV